jgi:hypothetical protein
MHSDNGTMSEAEQRVAQSARRNDSGALWKVVPAGLVVFAVFVWGGYAAGWAWTGLSRGVTLWDWLQALALPVAVGMVPLLLRHRRGLHRTHKVAVAALLAGFAVLVAAGYAVPWAWTGFTGNTLWDWLNLALLPLVVATSAVWPVPERWTARHASMAAAGLGAAMLIVVAGYTVPLTWTGFVGNTAWDWIRLLLLPVLLPTLVLPRLVGAADEWISERSEHTSVDP